MEVLSVDKKTAMKISKEWANGKISSYGDTKQKQFFKKKFDHKESRKTESAEYFLRRGKNV